MRQIRDFSDDRYHGYCVLCGVGEGTRDHVPSLVFLDEPYPDNLPVVTACRACNNSLSLDEEYTACLVECAVAGDVSPSSTRRGKIQVILAAKPALRLLLEHCKSTDDDGVVRWTPDPARVERVLLKLARGHVAFELGVTHTEAPSRCRCAPLITLSQIERARFESRTQGAAWPEVGSRSFHRAVTGADLSEKGWVVVQPDRYRYVVFQDAGDVVRLVIGGYLACEVIWE